MISANTGKYITPLEIIQYNPTNQKYTNQHYNPNDVPTGHYVYASLHVCEKTICYLYVPLLMQEDLSVVPILRNDHAKKRASGQKGISKLHQTEESGYTKSVCKLVRLIRNTTYHEQYVFFCHIVTNSCSICMCEGLVLVNLSWYKPYNSVLLSSNEHANVGLSIT